MPLWEIHFKPENKIVEVRVTGQVSKESDRDSMTKEAIQEGAKYSCSRFLVDLNKATAIYSLVDLYNRVEMAFPRLGIKHGARIAVIPPAGFVNKNFFETVASNRGYAIKVFDSSDEAVRWLTAR